MIEKKNTHHWLLEGLDCAHCATEIEEGVVSIPGIKKCTVNLMTETLSFTTETEEEHILRDVQEKINKIEPKLILKNKDTKELINILSPNSDELYTTEAFAQHEWVLEGLDCAHCATKIEDAVSKINGVNNLQINYMTKTLSFNLMEDNREKILALIKSQIKKTEPKITPLVKTTGEEIVIENEQMSTTSNQKEKPKKKPQTELKILLARLGLSLLILLLAVFLKVTPLLTFSLFVIAYFIAGYDVIWSALRNVFNGQFFDENFLMTIATFAAFYVQQYPEAVSVMLFYQLGEMFQTVALNKSRQSISDLMDIRPDYANIKGEDGRTEQVSPETIQVGDTILIRPGEKVPLDGKVIKGTSSMDTSALTGESIPRTVRKNDEVLSGFINNHGLLDVLVEKPFAQSTATKILKLVEDASSRKAPTEKFITKFARFYTPIVVISAILLTILLPLFFPEMTWNDSIYRAAIFLVISCPCALVVSIPVGFFGGIGAASNKGILVKGGNFLEALNHIKYVVMDKTGTLTKGNFEVNTIKAAPGIDQKELLEMAAYAEVHSSHPIADSIIKYYRQKMDERRISEYEDISGHGVRAVVDGKEVIAGNASFMEKYDFSFQPIEEFGTVIYVAIEKQYAGYLLIRDAIKKDAEQGISSLRKHGVEHIIMLTGDSKDVAEAVGQQLGINKIYSELLPQDKAEKMEEIMTQKNAKENVAFVGDGINDTPVLTRADIGIAMGGLGSDAAIEAADIVIMDDQPSKITTAMQIAKETRKIVIQNITFALIVKGFFLVLGAFGVATMWEAVFSDVGVTVLAILNAMRILKKE